MDVNILEQITRTHLKLCVIWDRYKESEQIYQDYKDTISMLHSSQEFLLAAAQTADSYDMILISLANMQSALANRLQLEMEAQNISTHKGRRTPPQIAIERKRQALTNM